ncbi:IlvGEDA operon leader peptide [Providencia heimbachae]
MIPPCGAALGRRKLK